jgi:hypothetical protein
MRRYHFNVTDQAPDDRGRILPTEGVARMEAARVFGQLVTDMAAGLVSSTVMEVRDDDGDLVLRLELTAISGPRPH